MTAQKTDLNTARLEELTRLPRIGPALAERIVTYRASVGRFQEPAQVRAVPGIGEKTYSAVADYVMVSFAETASSGGNQAPTAEPGEGDGNSGEREIDAQAAPPGDSVSEPDTDSARLDSEHRWIEPPETAENEVRKEPAGAAEQPTEMDAADEGRPTGNLPPDNGERPKSFGSRPAPPPRASCWGRLSWLWTALLGGILGMVFALAVFAGVNGSLDVARSRAVLSIEGRMETLIADVDSVEGSVEGLRQRVNALEGLTARMDRVESSLDDLHHETAELTVRADALEQDLGVFREEVQAIADDVEALQEQAERTESFFLRLQALLNDVFGEGERHPNPIPENK